MGLKQSLSKKLAPVYTRTNTLSGGVPGIILYATRSFSEAGGSAAAASIAYYALFSIFPMLLVLVAIASAILTNDQVQKQAFDYALQWIPVSQNLIRENIDQLLEARGTVGLIGILGLLWSSATVFTVLIHNINLAWARAKPRNFVASRLMGMVIVVVGVLVLMTLALLSQTAVSMLERFDIPLLGTIQVYDSFLWNLISPLIPIFFIFVMFLSIYIWVPNVDVGRAPAFWGAVAATTLWELSLWGFSWYLSSGLARFNLVYGSLGALVALMLWIYLVGLIILFGAHVSAAVFHAHMPTETEQEGSGEAAEQGK